MRNLSRTMIGLLLGAAMLTPIAAQAQERGRDRGGEQGGGWQRGGREGGWQRGGGDRPAAAPAESRREVFQQRSEARAVERPAVERPTLSPRAAEARIDNVARDRAARADGARGWEQRREAMARNNEVVRGNEVDRRSVERRDWNRDGRRGDRDGVRTVDRDRNWDRDGRFDGNRRWTTDRRDWNGRNDRSWNRDWRNDRRYGWQDYRNHNRNIYRLPRYQGHYGYSYRRWSPGYRFDPWVYSSSYWIDDPFYYRLPPAYGDYRWVRYFDDVALVDIRTGEIVDIIYSFFF